MAKYKLVSRIIVLIVALAMVLGLVFGVVSMTASAAGGTIVGINKVHPDISDDPVGDESVSVSEGSVKNELTGLYVDPAVSRLRPVAVMVDNEKTALPHYGVADADIVYELVNSLANNRITRFMCLYKNWVGAGQIGSIRSTRPSNLLLMSEWDGILIHDGGPFYNNQYYDLTDHISGGFTRIANGKAREFTEYAFPGEIMDRVDKAGFDMYNDDVKEHFKFTEPGKRTDLGSFDNCTSVVSVQLPYGHNQSKLDFDESISRYVYSEYGQVHKDAETNDVLSFDNVILQNCTFMQYDANGYFCFNCVGTGNGYYICDGKAIPIVWKKDSESSVTRYYDTDNNEIIFTVGKTYITLVPSDSWELLKLS